MMMLTALLDFALPHVSSCYELVLPTWVQFLYFLYESKPDIRASEIITVVPKIFPCKVVG